MSAPITRPRLAAAKYPAIMVPRAAGRISVKKEMDPTMVNSPIRKDHEEAAQGKGQRDVHGRQDGITYPGEGAAQEDGPPEAQPVREGRDEPLPQKLGGSR